MPETSPQSSYPVCQFNQLSDAECLEFRLPDQREAFLIRWRGKYYAYLNNCPHTGVNLNWMPDQFLDFESRFIQCSVHGAVFEPDSGLCIRGPCLGQSLPSLPLTILDGMVCLDLNTMK